MPSLCKKVAKTGHKFEKALSVKGTDARTSKDRVEKWLKEIGY